MSTLYVIQNALNQVWETLYSLCLMCAVKIPVAVGATAFAFLFGVHNGQAMLALIVIMAIDMITGIWSAKASGQVIESKKALKTASKFFVYCLFISASYLAESIVPGTTLLDEAAISWLAITELISIMENIGKLGYQLPLKLLNRLEELRNGEARKTSG